MTVFSKRLTEIIRTKGISQKELAKKTGITESAISCYVNGTRVPRSDVLSRIAKVLDISTDYLMGNDLAGKLSPKQGELMYLQRNLSKLDSADLKKAENILKVVFNDIFDDEEE